MDKYNDFLNLSIDTQPFVGTKLHYITVATKPHEVLEKIKQRLDSQQETITVLGAEEDRYIGWHAAGNFGIKLKVVQEFLQREDLDDHDIVLFTDAYDVIYYSNFAEILKRYNEYATPIVFGCEKFCNPVPSYEQFYKIKDTEFPYLNSGMFIGRVYELRLCMSSYKYEDKHDDQVFWTIQYINHRHFITLDYENRLFLNTVGLDINDVYVTENGCFYKDKNPLFLHVNGPVKTDLQLEWLYPV